MMGTGFAKAVISWTGPAVGLGPEADRESMADYIEGTGIPGGRVTAARRASSIEYGTYETKGCLTIYLEYFTENQALIPCLLRHI